VIVIGELINGMYKDVARAITNRETDVIQHLAVDQMKAGANVLDVNTGPYSKNPKDDMKWLIETIQKATRCQLALDSTKPDVIEEGLKLLEGRGIINSTSADDEKMDRIFTLAKKYKAQVIGLTMDKSGVPNSKDKRLELAAAILAKSAEYDIIPADIFLDPIVLPVNVAQTQGHEVLEAIREFKLLSDPAPHAVVGLSNVSQGTKLRELVNRTFLVMAVAAGLDAAILDPLDKELMDAMITAELILNKHIYCDSFLEAGRKG